MAINDPLKDIKYEISSANKSFPNKIKRLFPMESI